MTLRKKTLFWVCLFFVTLMSFVVLSVLAFDGGVRLVMLIGGGACYAAAACILLDRLLLTALNQREQAQRSAETAYHALQAHSAQLEQALEESQRQNNFLQSILNSMDSAVLYVSGSTIRYTNAALLVMTGYTSAEIEGQPLNLLLPTPPRMFTPISAVHHGERKLRAKDGTLTDVSYAEAGSLAPQPEAIIVLRDISREKEHEARKDRFLASASHELRNPLTNLITRLYVLRRQPEEFNRHMTMLESLAAHMKSLVDDLLDISRFKKGSLPMQRGNHDLSQLIREVVELQEDEATRKQIDLHADLPTMPIYAYIDRNRFMQVVSNLIANAINYTPEGGSVFAELETQRRADTLYAVIRVRDTGIGMDAVSVSQIFQPFFRVSQDVPGTGLGLTIVQEIVHRHGGEITVDSTPGKGSTFTVKILALPVIERVPE